jgi:DNA-binding MltR family transcriptional regulator
VGDLEDRMSRIQRLDPDALSNLWFKNDDRTTAIMVTSFLEDFLAIAILHKFHVKPTEDQLNELFAGYGPLASLAGKVAIGYALGAISADGKHDLGIIRKIRNDFAHTMDPLTFDSQEIASRCHSLKLTDNLRSKRVEERAGNGPRGKFIRSAAKIFEMTMMSIHMGEEEHKLLQRNKEELSKRASESLATWEKPKAGS